MVRKCKRCGNDRDLTEYYRYASGAVNPWCKSCYRSWYVTRAGGMAERSCDECGTRTTVTSRRASEVRFYCSRECKDRAHNATLKASRIASKGARPCLWCGGRIGPERRSDASYCSATCNAKAHSRTRNYHRRAGSRARARRTHLVSLVTIAWRSRWRCGLCGKRVRPSLAHPNPMAPSLDHIIPLARGGAEDDANLQLTHLVCNLRKRATD